MDREGDATEESEGADGREQKNGARSVIPGRAPDEEFILEEEELSWVAPRN